MNLNTRTLQSSLNPRLARDASGFEGNHHHVHVGGAVSGSRHPAWGRELCFHTGGSAEDGAFAVSPTHPLAYGT